MTSDPPRRPRRSDPWVVTVSAAVVGMAIWTLLHPTSGIDRNPPECYSTFGYVVPCGSGLSFGLAAVGAVVAGAVVYRLQRRRSR